MKVWIHGRVYDSEEEPICIVLTETEKEHLKSLSVFQHYYLSIPGHINMDQAERLLETIKFKVSKP